MSADNIVAPVFRDLLDLGLDRGRVAIATAFYSSRALQRLQGAPDKLTFMCRLSVDEWQAGMIDPPGLLSRLAAFARDGTAVELFVASDAHAKFYIGHSSALVGSPNLTMHGFGGGREVVRRIAGSKALADLHRMARAYAAELQAYSIAELGDFVAQHQRSIQRVHRRRRPQDRLPRAPRSGIPRLGSYADFLDWLANQTEEAAEEVYQRAHGKGNLQGHIHRNFFGLHQFLLANPNEMTVLAVASPDRYRLFADAGMEEKVEDFVLNYATDEADFSLDTWKTYLPLECGGRAGRRGGTIGNLNRMLPLVARYLTYSLAGR